MDQDGSGVRSEGGVKVRDVVEVNECCMYLIKRRAPSLFV